MKGSAGRLGALVLVLLMAAGACCCHGALLAELTRPSHSCCEGKSKSTHEAKSCQCAGQILAEGKVQQVSNLTAPVLPVPVVFFDVPMQPSFSTRDAVRLGQATAHPPPPRQAQCFLQIWLI